jgi:serine/threonine protein kinase
LLNETGRAFIADFGVSLVIEGIQAHDMVAAGTFNYMAPEMFGAALHQSVAVDVWSAGCVVLEMLTGQKPFESLSFEVCRVWCFSLASFP